MSIQEAYAELMDKHKVGPNALFAFLMDQPYVKLRKSFIGEINDPKELDRLDRDLNQAADCIDSDGGQFTGISQDTFHYGEYVYELLYEKGKIFLANKYLAEPYLAAQKEIKEKNENTIR